MKVYYRAQGQGHSFSEMQSYVSEDGGDDCEEQGGLCACDCVDDLLNNTIMGAMSEDDEVIIFEGRKLCNIYDGYRVEPVKELARFTIKYFCDNTEEMQSYERW